MVLFHRQTGRRPREQAALLLANLPAVESDLQDGAPGKGGLTCAFTGLSIVGPPGLEPGTNGL